MSNRLTLEHPDFAHHAKQMAKKHIAETHPERWAHIKSVAHKVEALAEQLLEGDDVTAVTVAAWLHDIGYANEISNTGFHPLDGAKWLEEINCDPRIVALVAHHSCADIEAEERGLSVEMMAYAKEDSLAADILLYADFTTGPDGKTYTVKERLIEISNRYGPEHVVPRFLEKAEPFIMMAEERVKNKLGLDRPL